jgi:hypothetical protein
MAFYGVAEQLAEKISRAGFSRAEACEKETR